MKFTGERYVPSEPGTLRYEHLHRYLLCLNFVLGKSVVDIACGEGYGSSILSTRATRVRGIDISSESIEFARSKYQNKNLTFLQGSCEAIPIESESIDVVVSLETIEHHDKHDEMLLEIKRILKPNGILIVSSPNRLFFAQIPNYSNPFHIKELDFDELNILLNRYFNNVYFYGQRMVSNSLIMPLKALSLENVCVYSQNNESSFTMDNPPYFLAICSDDAREYTHNINSIYLDSLEDIYEENRKVLAQIEAFQKSNFGKMRELWMKLKLFFGIPKEHNIFPNKNP
jgi:ubiquinone/menaquinone biosynthesis C-methylase UbiE